MTNEFDSESFTSASERRFSLIANVVPGTEIQESVRAQQAGLTDVRVLENINAITFQGTFSQILIFVTDNADLREITGGGLHFIDKPIQLENEGNSEQKAINLQSNVEDVTQVSIANNLGYKGKGTTIAILDTGLDCKS